MKILKLLKLIKPESLARARKRIRSEIKSYNNTGISTNSLSQAVDGYYKDRNINYG